MILVDTNVLIDALAADPAWLDWSVDALHRASEGDQPVINESVYAELAAAYDPENAMLDDLRQLAIRSNDHRRRRCFSQAAPLQRTAPPGARV